MLFLSPEQLPPMRIQRSFRHGSLGPLCWLTLVAIMPILVVRMLLPELLGWPDVAWSAVTWLAVGPALLLATLLWALVVQGFAEAFLATLRGTNWVMRIGDEGVLLNLRSYLNHRVELEEPSVVYLPWRRIARASHVRERIEHEGYGEPVVERRRYLQLELDGVDTSGLAEAVRMERARKASELSFLGIRTRTKYRHVPLYVSSYGVLRIEWLPGMLDALEGRVKIVRTADEEELVGSPEERILTLVERGQQMAAVKLARSELGLGLSEARQRVEALRRRSA
jgi:hypothetical protein